MMARVLFGHKCNQVKQAKAADAYSAAGHPPRLDILDRHPLSPEEICNFSSPGSYEPYEAHESVESSTQMGPKIMRASRRATWSWGRSC